jgi:hypothetical protein
VIHPASFDDDPVYRVCFYSLYSKHRIALWEWDESLRIMVVNAAYDEDTPEGWAWAAELMAMRVVKAMRKVTEQWKLTTPATAASSSKKRLFSSLPNGLPL